MSISGPDDAKTPTKVRQPPAKRRLDNGQGWLSTCLPSSSTTTSFDVDIVPLQNIVYFFIHRKQPPRPINEISVREREGTFLENACVRRIGVSWKIVCVL